MDIFQIIALLKTLGTVTAALALICAIPAIIMTRKHTPAQLRKVIQEAEFLADPRHRKAVLAVDEQESAEWIRLTQVPDTSHLTGWQGISSREEETFHEKAKTTAPAYRPAAELELMSASEQLQDGIE